MSRFPGPYLTKTDLCNAAWFKRLCRDAGIPCAGPRTAEDFLRKQGKVHALFVERERERLYKSGALGA